MRLDTRKRTWDSCWWLIDMNTGPQIGISIEPWAGVPVGPEMVLETCDQGNLPLFRSGRPVIWWLNLKCGCNGPIPAADLEVLFPLLQLITHSSFACQRRSGRMRRSVAGIRSGDRVGGGRRTAPSLRTARSLKRRFFHLGSFEGSPLRVKRHPSHWPSTHSRKPSRKSVEARATLGVPEKAGSASGSRSVLRDGSNC